MVGRVNRTDLLAEAARLIAGERDEVYGSPQVNHDRIARLWSAFLDMPIHPAQVAVCMALVKVSRLTASPDHLDSYVDGAAYLAIAGELKPSERQSGQGKSVNIGLPQPPPDVAEPSHCLCC